MKRFTLIALTLLAIAPVHVRAQAARPVIAVLYFDNNSFGKDAADYNGLGKGIADMLITDMASNTAVRVVERAQIQSLLTEQNLTKAGTIDPQTAVRLGKIIGAQYMITGGFMSDSKGTLIVTARAINVETSAITNPMKLTSKGDDVLGLINQLSTKLNSDLQLPALRVGDAGGAAAASGGAVAASGGTAAASGGAAAATSAGASAGMAPVPATASQAGQATASASTQVAKETPSPAAASTHPAPTHVAQRTQGKMDLRTAMLYSRALEEEDAGNNARAVELYRQVVDKFPDYAPARAKIDKLSRG